MSILLSSSSSKWLFVSIVCLNDVATFLLLCLFPSLSLDKVGRFRSLVLPDRDGASAGPYPVLFLSNAPGSTKTSTTSRLDLYHRRTPRPQHNPSTVPQLNSRRPYEQPQKWLEAKENPLAESLPEARSAPMEVRSSRATPARLVSRLVSHNPQPTFPPSPSSFCRCIIRVSAGNISQGML